MVWVGRLRGGRDLHNVFQVGEDFLFNRLLQALVRGVLELPALARVGRNTNQNLLAEGVLRVLADPDLLLDGAHQLLVRLHLFFGDRVFDLLLVAVGLDVVEVVVAHRPRHLLERIDEGALHLGLRHLVVLLAGRRDEVQVALALVERNPRVLLKPALDRAQGVNRVDTGDAVAHERRRQAVDDVARADAVHPLAHGLLFQLAHVLRLVAFHVLAVVELHLLDDVHVGALRLFQPGHHGEHRGDLQGARRDVDVAQDVGLVEELVVDSFFLRDAEVVGDAHQDDAVLQRLTLLVARERDVLVLVRVRHDDLVGVDHREAARLDVLLLREREQGVEELLVNFEHLDELHDAAVGDVQFAVEAVGARVTLHPDLADGREVNRAGQLRDVLRLRV